jgi:hypothetical protein
VLSLPFARSTSSGTVSSSPGAGDVVARPELDMHQRPPCDRRFWMPAKSLFQRPTTSRGPFGGLRRGSVNLALLATLAGLGCQSSNSGPLPPCTWPALYDRGDASGTGRCTAGRAYLLCKASNGGSLGCLSDNEKQCPAASSSPDVTYSDCQNQCEPGEYAMWCNSTPLGDAGSGPTQPPAGCRPRSHFPGGSSVYCCPCGS